MQKPNNRPLTTCRAFVHGKAHTDKQAEAMPMISGQAKGFLDEHTDLVALAGPTKREYLSQFLQDHWIFRKRITSDPFDRTTVHKNLHIERIVAALNMILAAILLISAIVNLYLVPDPKAKLGLVAIYTMLFASSVVCETSRGFCRDRDVRGSARRLRQRRPRCYQESAVFDTARRSDLEDCQVPKLRRGFGSCFWYLLGYKHRLSKRQCVPYKERRSPLNRTLSVCYGISQQHSMLRSTF